MAFGETELVKFSSILGLNKHEIYLWELAKFNEINIYEYLTNFMRNGLVSLVVKIQYIFRKLAVLRILVF